ncbi:YceI family protein [Pelobacter propionicus]|uniref:YceI family protein n=1 Tax=Pelobacter propionicus (strain DSM 2379 / NBRC 103807 / OttBd1) TaxID=338966 RepID=A1ATC8_PELPD|nr:YceI family protein [Pelobacter propionicus]ABL00599.1 YceI family protein [Pelobacter propionicus DSM 2379]
MKRFISLVTLLLLALPLSALASTWNLDPDHSAAQFKVKHLMISNVRGNFEKISATLHLDDRDITKSRVEVSIDVASINTGVNKRDDHLRSPDFFDVTKFPAMTFVSTRVEKAGPGKLSVTGNLTIKGVTRPVVLRVDGLTPEVRDPWGQIRRGASATTTINRRDFGITWNKSMDNGGVVVGEEVAIQLEVEFVRK